jgi:hypothetical protein
VLEVSMGVVSVSDEKTVDSTVAVSPDDGERLVSIVGDKLAADTAKIPTEAQAITTYLLMRV